MTMDAQTPTPETGLDTSRLGDEATATGAPMEKARLGGVDGLGTIQVVRGRNDELLEIRGTWRPSDDSAQDDGVLSQLCSAAESGDAVQYQGPVVDPERGISRATVDVTFTSTSRYTFNDEDGVREAGPSRRIFNFTPVEGASALQD